MAARAAWGLRVRGREEPCACVRAPAHCDKSLFPRVVPRPPARPTRPPSAAPAFCCSARAPGAAARLRLSRSLARRSFGCALGHSVCCWPVAACAAGAAPLCACCAADIPRRALSTSPRLPCRRCVGRPRAGPRRTGVSAPVTPRRSAPCPGRRDRAHTAHVPFKLTPWRPRLRRQLRFPHLPADECRSLTAAVRALTPPLLACMANRRAPATRSSVSCSSSYGSAAALRSGGRATSRRRARPCTLAPCRPTRLARGSTV